MELEKYLAQFGRGGAVVLLLIGVGMIAGAGVVGSFCLRDYALAREAAAWPEVEARVLYAALESQAGGGEDHTSYRAVCQYEYEYEGATYEGSRVGINTGADNIGQWQRNTAYRLEQAFVKGEPVACYVSPDDPTQALLDRELRVRLMFSKLVWVAALLGVGATVVVAGVRAFLRSEASAPAPVG